MGWCFGVTCTNLPWLPQAEVLCRTSIHHINLVLVKAYRKSMNVLQDTELDEYISTSTSQHFWVGHVPRWVFGKTMGGRKWFALVLLFLGVEALDFFPSIRLQIPSGKPHSYGLNVFKSPCDQSENSRNFDSAMASSSQTVNVITRG